MYVLFSTWLDVTARCRLRRVGALTASAFARGRRGGVGRPGDQVGSRRRTAEGVPKVLAEGDGRRIRWRSRNGWRWWCGTDEGAAVGVDVASTSPRVRIPRSSTSSSFFVLLDRSLLWLASPLVGLSSLRVSKSLSVTIFHVSSSFLRPTNLKASAKEHHTPFQSTASIKQTRKSVTARRHALQRGATPTESQKL